MKKEQKKTPYSHTNTPRILIPLNIHLFIVYTNMAFKPPVMPSVLRSIQTTKPTETFHSIPLTLFKMHVRLQFNKTFRCILCQTHSWHFIQLKSFGQDSFNIMFLLQLLELLFQFVLEKLQLIKCVKYQHFLFV